MIEGLYAAASGMIGNEGTMSVIANNVANAATPGFRRQVAVQNGFYEVLLSRFRQAQALNFDPGPGGGLEFVETFTDPRSGGLTRTGDPLNVALQGPGFFAIQAPQGVRYTRNGTFAVNPQGQLVTPDGYPVLSVASQPIEIGDGSVEITSEGRVLSDGDDVGQIQVVEFADPHMLSREGHNLYVASEAALGQSAPGTGTAVVPGSVEASNVQVPYEMTRMILALRHYNANQKVVTTLDETIGRLINEVGAPI